MKERAEARSPSFSLDGVPRLAREGGSAGEEPTRNLVSAILRRRTEFGLTRVGAITRLDRVGIPVVQVVRPGALSNVVTQGKGKTVLQAQASALMEAIETWAGEGLAPSFTARISEVRRPLRRQFEPVLTPAAGSDPPLAWTEGWDLMSDSAMSVPLALVDTDFTISVPHPPVFRRSTTGLGGGSSMGQAVLQGMLEILERDAVARAHKTSGFFDDRQVDLGSVPDGAARAVLQIMRACGLAAGAWLVPADHALPVYWCHAMAAPTEHELAPLPASGFACGLSHDEALAKALLEACQARLSAISGAREDITWRQYPGRHDREALWAWHGRLASPTRTRAFPVQTPSAEQAQALGRLLAALSVAGASAVIVVPLFVDPDDRIFVVRVVAPPLSPFADHHAP